MKTETYTLPMIWSGALISGIYTGDSADDDAIDAWLAAHPHLGPCLSCGADDSCSLRKHHDARFLGVLPCMCLDFTFPVDPQ